MRSSVRAQRGVKIGEPQFLGLDGRPGQGYKPRQFFWESQIWVLGLFPTLVMQMTKLVPRDEAAALCPQNGEMGTAVPLRPRSATCHHPARGALSPCSSCLGGYTHPKCWLWHRHCVLWQAPQPSQNLSQGSKGCRGGEAQCRHRVRGQCSLQGPHGGYPNRQENGKPGKISRLAS